VEVIDRLKLFKLEKSVLSAGKLFHITSCTVSEKVMSGVGSAAS